MENQQQQQQNQQRTEEDFEQNCKQLSIGKATKKQRRYVLWSKKEDKYLLCLFKKYDNNWTAIAHQLNLKFNGEGSETQKKSNIQCRERYYNHLNPTLTSKCSYAEKIWSHKEDQLLVQKRRENMRWCEISKQKTGKLQLSYKWIQKNKPSLLNETFDISEEPVKEQVKPQQEQCLQPIIFYPQPIQVPTYSPPICQQYHYGANQVFTVVPPVGFYPQFSGANIRQRVAVPHLATSQAIPTYLQ